MPLQLLRQAAAAFRRGRSDEGQDLLEYALLVSLVVIACISAVDTLGTVISSSFWEIIAATDF